MSGHGFLALLLSIIALCWFHLIHAQTVAPAVGVSLDDAAELERRKRHVIGLVLYGLRGLEHPAATLIPAPAHD